MIVSGGYGKPPYSFQVFANAVKRSEANYHGIKSVGEGFMLIE